jgi:hypothetical protein
MDNGELEAIMEDIKGIYKQNHILIDGKDVLLHENCKFKDNCWTKQAIQERAFNWNRISFPYIGNEYDGFICIGLNLNECGGKNALIEIINGNSDHLGVRKYLEKGNKTIDFDNQKYHKTVLWHRIGVYANIILNNEIIPDNGKNLSDIYNKIAYLEAIKCSPKNRYSEPEEDMHLNCPRHIMLKEIEILKPKTILVLGKVASNSIKATFDYYNIKKECNVAYYQFELGGNVVNVFEIIHPTAPGGNSIGLYEKLYNIKPQNIAK